MSARRTAATVRASVSEAVHDARGVHSSYEGWAVLMGRFDDLTEHLETANGTLQGMWHAVRAGHEDGVRDAAQGVAEAAERAAAAAIATAAQAQRFLADLPETTS